MNSDSEQANQVDPGDPWQATCTDGRVHFESMLDTPRGKCERCEKGEYWMSRSCGAKVCDDCGHHHGLARCYCGWSADGTDGRRELLEMGETIEEDY